MQPVKFCAQDCGEVAIKAARSADLCRAHYRSDILAKATDLVTCQVTTTFGTRGEDTGVSDAVTNEMVTSGGTVVLDPLETNIPALVAGGVVKVLAKAKADKVKE